MTLKIWQFLLTYKYICLAHEARIKTDPNINTIVLYKSFTDVLSYFSVGQMRIKNYHKCMVFYEELQHGHDRNEDRQFQDPL